MTPAKTNAARWSVDVASSPEQARDFLIDGDAAGHVAGMALAEERDRRAQHVPDEPACHQSPSDLEPQQVMLAKRGLMLAAPPVSQTGQQRPEPSPTTADQHLIHKSLANTGKAIPGSTRVRLISTTSARPLRNRQLPPQHRKGARSSSAAAELDAGLECQHSGEGLGQLGERKLPSPNCWIVDVSPIAPKPFEDDEMIEVPVDDRWPRQLLELLGLFFEALCRHPVLAGRLDDVAGLAAVTGNAARDA